MEGLLTNDTPHRLAKLIINEKTVIGGTVKPESCYIEPTIMTNTTLDDLCMQDEIFGPILPVIRDSTIEDAVAIVRSFPKPLALYLFSENKAIQDDLMNRLPFGGGGINTTILHVASVYLPFGGVGQSGMGSYHGKASFEAFSHQKSVLKQPSFPDLGLSYPGSKVPLSWIRKFMKG